MEEEKKDVQYINNYAKSLAKLSTGYIPIIGPIVSEIVGNLIPDQRMTRIESFIEIFDKKIKDLEIDFDILQNKMKNEDFIDLFEEACFQASRSKSEDRKEYLASILINGLEEESLDYIEKVSF